MWSLIPRTAYVTTTRDWNSQSMSCFSINAAFTFTACMQCAHTAWQSSSKTSENWLQKQSALILTTLLSYLKRKLISAWPLNVFLNFSCCAFCFLWFAKTASMDYMNTTRPTPVRWKNSISTSYISERGNVFGSIHLCIYVSVRLCSAGQTVGPTDIKLIRNMMVLNAFAKLYVRKSNSSTCNVQTDTQLEPKILPLPLMQETITTAGTREPDGYIDLKDIQPQLRNIMHGTRKISVSLSLLYYLWVLFPYHKMSHIIKYTTESIQYFVCRKSHHGGSTIEWTNRREESCI